MVAKILMNPNLDDQCVPKTIRALNFDKFKLGVFVLSQQGPVNNTHFGGKWK